MGCCTSSPHAKRRYRDPADFDEEFVLEKDLPLRTFGKFRGNGVIVPDDVDGLPSTRDDKHLANDPHSLLYEAEIDNGRAWRCLRPCAVQSLATEGVRCDEICCWVRKEYFTRSYYRIYPNRIEVNTPRLRIPWGMCGCGSWNADAVLAHPFDRGAFGFQRVQTGAMSQFCCFIPCYGDVVARQRCQCNGPVWHGGWWCDEWVCKMLCCAYRYPGLADGDEVAFASNLALQAYYEGRKFSAEDMEKCLQYWRENVSEYHDLVNHKRPVMCEPHCIVPCCPTINLYGKCCQIKRNVPFKDERATPELKEVYAKYERLRQRQMKRYAEFKYPARTSSVCRALGCQRCCGRKGVIFCTEGCSDNKALGFCYRRLKRQPTDAFPPMPHTDLDDEYHAAKVLRIILGDPPQNVVYKEWKWDSAAEKYVSVTLGAAESVAEEPNNTNMGSSNNEQKGAPESEALLARDASAPASDSGLTTPEPNSLVGDPSIETTLPTAIDKDAEQQATVVCNVTPSTSLHKGKF